MNAKPFSASRAAGFMGGLLCAIFVGCEGRDPEPSSPVSISPDTVEFTAGTVSNATLTVEGGAGPYTWTVADSSLGSIAASGTTAVYQRTAASGRNIVTVTDTNGYQGTAMIYQDYSSSPLTIDPEETSLGEGDSNVVLQVSGGTEPYDWSLSDHSLGSLDEHGSYAIYARGSGVGVNLVTVKDADGYTATAQITQSDETSPLTLDPEEASLAGAESNVVFEVTGGSEPYSWSLSDRSLGSLAANDSYAVYTRNNSVGFNQVTVEDADGNSVTALVSQSNTTQVALNISPSSATLAAGVSNATFQATGGTEPYAWSLNDASLGSLVSSDEYAIFVRTNATGAGFVTVTDSAGDSATAYLILQ